MSIVVRTLCLYVFVIGAHSAIARGIQESSKPKSFESGEGEAPALAQAVALGLLPPVEERLPNEPLVLQPVNEIGIYGGELRRTYRGPTDSLAFGRLVWEPALRFSMDGLTVIPNVAMSWDISDDGQVFTLRFREGMKWSDGVPFTSDDVLFWYEDIILQPELTPSPPRWMMSGGQIGVIDRIDDLTVEISFDHPYPFFIRELAYRGNGYPAISAPAHHMRRFHKKYADQETLDLEIEESGFENWSALFADRNSIWTGTGIPTLAAWTLASEPGDIRLVAERNPFFWKVDPNGNQLPYIDRVVHDLIENKEVAIMRMLNGEIDAQWRGLTISDYPLLKESEETGDYTVVNHDGDRASHVAFWPNMSHEDPVYNELMNSTEFKKALMYAIDRDELNDLFYFGLGEPRAVTAIRSEPTYEPDVAGMNIKYDPEEANHILDNLGYDKRNDRGVRLGPDGEPISFLVPYSTAWPWMGEIGQVVLDYWAEIGIDSQLKAVERSLFFQLSLSNEIPLTLLSAPGTSLSNSWWIFPQRVHNSTGYGLWYRTGGNEGVEPPVGSRIRMAQELFDEVLTSADIDSVIEAVKQILRWGNEEIWGIGLVGEIPAPGVVRNNVGNVARNAPSGTHLMHPGNLYPEQWYFTGTSID